MKKNVLIFPGGGCTPPEIYSCLIDTLRYHPILGSSRAEHSEFISEESVHNLPFTEERDFVTKLNSYIKSANIEFIIPTHDTAALVLMENKEKINATIVCSPLETTRMCRYKSLTYKKLKETDILPEIYTYDNPRYPLFAKNDIGQGGQDSYIINNREELETIRKHNLDYVLCELLPGEEITVDCFTDRHGKLLFAQPRTRSRLLHGISARSSTIDITDEISHMTESINSNISFRGYWYFQAKQDSKGKYKLMEISTRFAGTFPVSKNLDVNLPLLSLRDFENADIEIIPNKYHVSADKSYYNLYKIDYEYKRVYIDFDDTIVFNRKIYNTQMMMFLYQCINEKKEIYLITKHEYNIYETLNKVKITSEIFDKIIELKDNEPKYLYINNDVPAIFIDNAYGERALVKKYLGMPTFDTCNIECLIKGRR